VVDLTLLPLGLIDSARLSAGAAGVAQGAGALSGAVELLLAPVGGGGRLLAAAGGQAGRGIGVVDLQLGSEFGWVGGGYTRGGALPAGATSQGRYQLRFDFQGTNSSNISEQSFTSTAVGSALDGDGDGIAGPNGTNPSDPCSFDVSFQDITIVSQEWLYADCDGDGVTNGEEVDPDGDGIAGPNGTNPRDPC
jgi:hypothetical protein